jgi:hypothetical protein
MPTRELIEQTRAYADVKLVGKTPRATMHARLVSIERKREIEITKPKRAMAASEDASRRLAAPGCRRIRRSSERGAVFGFIRIFREYERDVVFRLGRLMDPPRGPGLVFLIPIADRRRRAE